MNSPWIVIVILAAFAIAALVWRARQNAKKVDSIEERVFGIPDSRKTRLVGSFTVWLEKGCKPLSGAQQLAIEDGLKETFRRMRAEYGDRLVDERALILTDYNVAIVKSIPDSQGNPCYKLPPGPYAGTEWDLGGYILAAGQMLTLQDRRGDNLIVIPEHSESQTQHIRLPAQFEAEHCALGWHDWDRFQATLVHTSGGHPILGDAITRHFTNYFSTATSETACAGCISGANNPRV